MNFKNRDAFNLLRFTVNQKRKKDLEKSQVYYLVKTVSMECEKDTDQLLSMIAHTIVKSMFQKSLIEKIKHLYTRANDKVMINDQKKQTQLAFTCSKLTI